MNAETLLKWASVASLCTLLIVLALQIAPRFIERAEAEFTTEPLPDEIATYKATKMHIVAAHYEHKKRIRDHRKWTKEFYVAQTEPNAQDIVVDPAPMTTRANESGEAPVVPQQEERRPFATTSEDLRRRHEALTPPSNDREPRRFDVQHEDLPSRHEALIADDPSDKPVRRFDYQREDLRSRHEALRAEDEPATKRFDLQREDLKERHEALVRAEPRTSDGDEAEDILDKPQNDTDEAAEQPRRQYRLLPGSRADVERSRLAP